MNDSAFLIDDILHPEQADPLESDAMPEARAFRISARHRFARLAQRHKLREVIAEPPAPGESIHCTTGGKFEFFTWIPAMVEWLGTSDSLYCSTWTCSRPNAVELFALADAGKIGRIHFVTGLYFKRREAGVYAFLLEGNAAGKSNLIRAMGVAQQMILERGSGFASVEPFRFDRDKVGQPSTFEFRVLLGDQVFVYGFDATNRNIVCEWLSVLKDDDELTIFERNNKGETTTESRTKRQFPDDTTMFDTLGKLAQLPLTGRQLFLSRILSIAESITVGLTGVGPHSSIWVASRQTGWAW